MRWPSPADRRPFRPEGSAARRSASGLHSLAGAHRSRNRRANAARRAHSTRSPDGSRAIVERLVDARLLVADRRAGIDVIEVAHESLLRQWPALTAWLDADAADLKLVEGVERAADEWAANDRLEAWLDHRAERLRAAKAASRAQRLPQAAWREGAAYLAACRAREDAERQEREEALAREQARLARRCSAGAYRAISADCRVGLAAASFRRDGHRSRVWQRQTNLRQAAAWLSSRLLCLPNGPG